MKLIIEIDEARFKDIQRIAEVQLEMSHFQTAEQIIAKGVPLEQEPKTGHWIERRNRATGRYESVCSVCGAEESSIYNLYCGNCGTEMQFT